MWSIPSRAKCGEQARAKYKISLFTTPCRMIPQGQLTWKALLNLKTRSYASLGANRLRASWVISFSSGNRSSYFKPSCLYPILVAYHLESGINHLWVHGRLTKNFVKAFIPMRAVVGRIVSREFYIVCRRTWQVRTDANRRDWSFRWNMASC